MASPDFGNLASVPVRATSGYVVGGIHALPWEHEKSIPRAHTWEIVMW